MAGRRRASGGKAGGERGRKRERGKERGKGEERKRGKRGRKGEAGRERTGEEEGEDEREKSLLGGGAARCYAKSAVADAPRRERS